MNATHQSCGRILVADADGQTRTYLCHLLEAVGIPTMQASTGEEALDSARHEHPDLAILEVALPHLSGYEVCRQLKAEIGSQIAIIFISSDRVEPRDRVAGLYVGGDDYLVKPLDPGELIARVRRLLPYPAQTAEFDTTPTVLTSREHQVLERLARGQSQTDIATELGISSKTVANHLQNVLMKLGAHSRAEAVALAYRDGLVE